MLKRLRRPLTQALHWVTALFCAAILAAGLPTPAWIAGTFGVAALGLALTGLAFGRMTRATPKLTPGQKSFHTWSHRGLYVLAGWAGLAMLAPFVSLSLPGPTAFDLAFYLFFASLFHGLFHIWRVTVLNDRAFAVMLPKFLHARP